MNRNYFVIIAGISLFCLLLIFVSLWQEIDTPVTKHPMVPPNAGPYQSQIYGVGIVEPSSGNIYIGTPLNKVVEKVYVKAGDKVEKGEKLFSLENKELEANFNVQKAIYESAIANLRKLKSLPRKEDLTIAGTELDKAKSALDFAEKQNEMMMRLTDSRAVSQEERNRRLSLYEEAKFAWQQAQANYEKVQAGTWKPDLKIAELAVLQAKANVDLVNADIEQTYIKSPIDGTVLQIRIHEGELPSMDSFGSPLMVIGNVDEMDLKVSINQLDIPRFHSEAPAVAYLQGDGRTEFPLEFIRIEPLLVPKKNLTNEISETIDTRVLHVIYRIKNEGKHPIFTGQQMDVFIDTQKSLVK